MSHIVAERWQDNDDSDNAKYLEIVDELGGIVGLPKPRTGVLDHDIWSHAKSKAKLEVFKEFEIPDNAYYSSMCKIGKKLMIETIRKKAQDIYDYRCGKMIYRKNRKKGHDPQNWNWLDMGCLLYFTCFYLLS